MKRLMLLVTGIFWVLSVHAQTTTPGMSAQQRSMMEKLQSMTPEQREAFMANMQRQAKSAQSCFEKVDQARVQALEARGRAIKGEIDTLCRAGKTREAEAFAMREGRKMMDDPTAQQLAQCSQGFSKAFDFSPEAIAASGRSVCD